MHSLRAISVIIADFFGVKGYPNVNGNDLTMFDASQIGKRHRHKLAKGIVTNWQKASSQIGKRHRHKLAKGIVTNWQKASSQIGKARPKTSRNQLYRSFSLRLFSSDAFFFTYVYVRVLNTRQWTSLRVLNTPYVYVGQKNAGLYSSLILRHVFCCDRLHCKFNLSHRLTHWHPWPRYSHSLRFARLDHFCPQVH